jgi:hypothetical protein
LFRNIKNVVVGAGIFFLLLVAACLLPPEMEELDPNDGLDFWSGNHGI